MAASKAAEAAGEQGHYWEMHDAILNIKTNGQPSRTRDPTFARIANRIGINGTILVQTMDNPRLQDRVLQRRPAGRQAVIQAVPTFFINGQQVHIKLSMEDFVQVIDAQLHK